MWCWQEDRLVPCSLCTPWALARSLLARAQPRHGCCSACSPPELVFPEPHSRWPRPAFLGLTCGKVENTPSSLLPPRQPKPQTPGSSERDKMADQPGSWLPPGLLSLTCSLELPQVQQTSPPAAVLAGQEGSLATDTTHPLPSLPGLVQCTPTCTAKASEKRRPQPSGRC